MFHCLARGNPALIGAVVGDSTLIDSIPQSEVFSLALYKIAPMVKFDWKILLERITTVGAGAFCMGFSKSYVEHEDMKVALAAGAAWTIVGMFGGATYDQIKFRNAKRQ